MKFGKLWLLVISLIITFPTFLPLLRESFFPLHDYTHVTRLLEMDQALKDGHFPVRWSKDLGWGYGMPLFNFYGPLPYYLAEIFHLVGFSFLTAIKIIFFFNLLASFWGMYHFARLFWGKLPALVSATAFVYAPYHAVDLYVRGSLGELTAITFIPIALYCLTQLTRKRDHRWLAYSGLSLAAIATSHNLITFISLPLIGIAGLTLNIAARRKKLLLGMVKTTTAYLLGFLLSAFYLLPAWFEKNLVQIDRLTEGFSYYFHHFLYLRQFWHSRWGYGGSIFGLEDNISFEIGKVQLILAAIASISLIPAWKKKKSQTALMVVLSGIFIIFSGFMSSFKSLSVWQAIPQLAFIQFPWRFLSLIIVFVGFLAGAVIWFLPLKNSIFKLIASLLVIGTLIGTNVKFFKPEKYLDDNNSLYFTDIDRIQSYMSEIIPDFIPQTAKNIPPPQPPEDRYVFAGRIEQLDIQIDRTHEFIIKLEALGPIEFQVNIFYFPGWKLFVNGDESPPIIDPQQGTMKLKLDKGQYVLSGKFMETPIRQIANALSALGILIVLWILVNPKKQTTSPV